MDSAHHIAKMNNKYWIKKGARVRHQDIDSDLTVDRLIYKDVKQRDGTFKKFTLGVKCHWISSDGSFREGTFHTTELRPKEYDLETK